MRFRTIARLSLLTLTLAVGANASASLSEYYSLSSGPSVCASQITAISGHTLSFADGTVSSITDRIWWEEMHPEIGDYLVSDGGLSAVAGSSFEAEYDLETYVHGGHEPVIIILD